METTDEDSGNGGAATQDAIAEVTRLRGKLDALVTALDAWAADPRRETIFDLEVTIAAARSKETNR